MAAGVSLQPSSLQFAGQVAIVTGGAQGLGEGIVKMLVENGCSVMIFDVNLEKAMALTDSLRTKGYTVECCRVDVSDEQSVLEGFAALRAKFDRLDIMVNCAGILGPNAFVRTAEVKAEDFDQVYKVNTCGSFLMTKYSLEEMKKRNYGRILLMASLAGKKGLPGLVAYSTSKAAVIGMVKAAGKEYAETGITVNALASAAINTQSVEALMNSNPQQLKQLTDKIPMKRTGTIEEVNAITKFIVSKEASFNTACCFDLSGGWATY